MNVLELFKLDGRVALITGGASGLGYDMSSALAEAGADIVITSRSQEKAEGAAEKIRDTTGRRVVALSLVLPDEENVISVVEKTLESFGQLDVLVNSAGNVRSKPENNPFEIRPLELWQEAIELNLTGTFLVCKHVVARIMKPRKSGCIINIGSTAGLIGKDRRQYIGTTMGGATLDYHAAKGGVISMTRDMAVYLAPSGIRVNCISPGGFWRNQPKSFVEKYGNNVPMGRMGVEGKEIKGAVVFLASEASSYVTGANLVVDGGLTAW